ncbi:MAG: nuclear transport factor 2 family protein [Fidelibacterota bacterium]|nr:MAG: nuclear transport factor 2 family protein [Candidatus Neomarinimicrobiota bacterium]
MINNSLKLTLVLLIVCSLCVGVNNGEPVSTEEGTMEMILSLEKGAMERWRTGDPWGWTEISAQEVTYIDPGLTKPIVGLEEYKAYLKQLEGKIAYEGSEFIDPKVVQAGDAAVLTYNYRSSAATTEEPKETLWNTTEVYFRLEGKWKIVHTHWSYVKQKLPASLEVSIPVQLSSKQYEGVLGEVMALECVAMERWRKGDPWGFTDISAPDATYFDSGTPQRLDGLEALKAEYAPREGKIHYDVMEFIDPRIHVQGAMAVLTYRFFSTQLNPDGSIAKRTPWNCTEVYVRNEGYWEIIHTHWSFILGERM